MLLVTLSGCSGYDILQYKVPSTEERISVRIDKGNGLEIAANEDGTFAISQAGTLLATGVLMPPEKMQKMRTNAETMKTCEILEQGRQDNMDYMLLKVITNEEYEWVYLASIDGLEAGLAMSNSISEDALRACFAALSVRETQE